MLNNGLNIYKPDLNTNFDLNNQDLTVLFEIEDDFKTNIGLDKGNYTFLYLFKNVKNIKGDVCINVAKDTQVRVCYLDLTKTDVEFNFLANLSKDSELNLETNILSLTSKKMNLEVKHLEPNSFCRMDNSSILKDNGQIDLVANGNIIKGAKGSKHFQKSRCLTINTKNQGKILPMLLIDENDVEASHSLTFGTIDEEVLYYINSRGITDDDAVKLLVESYLIPDFSTIKYLEDASDIAAFANETVRSI